MARPRQPGGDIPRPFLKWAGGKRQLLPELLARVPAKFKGYHEPFVGGGALFFELARSGRLAGRRVRLTDVNAELVDAYRAIRDEVEAVIRALAAHRYDREHYYEVRGQDPAALEPARRAARMIFLNRAGFNGLYRVNSRGQFNVPFGRHKNPVLCDRDNLRAVAAALAGVEIERAPFERVLKHARKGDFVYFDPPYVPLSKTAYFVAYASDGFGRGDQERLAQVFGKLATKGVRAMLSNSDTDWVQKAYKPFHLHRVLARRLVNSRADRRGAIEELIVCSHDGEEVR